MIDTLSGLNDEQKKAVLARGVVCCIAGAGTGKTQTMVNAIIDRIQRDQCDKDQILAVTFTRKATKEMRERLIKMGSSPPKYMGNFHTISLALMKRFPELSCDMERIDIIDDTERTRIIKSILSQVMDKYQVPNLMGEMSDLSTKNIKWLADQFSDTVSKLKSNLVKPEDFEFDESIINDYLPQKKDQKDSDSELADCLHDILRDCVLKHYKDYNYICHISMGVIDFDDMIMLPVIAMQKNPSLRSRVSNLFRYLLVDEYQDTNYAQKVWLECMITTSNELFVVGDDGQSIYGWRGAKVDFIRNIFDNDDTQKIILTKNYRCSEKILNVGNEIISMDTSSIPKLLTAEGKDKNIFMEVDLFSYRNEHEECEAVAKEIDKLLGSGVEPKDIAVLSRTNYYIGKIGKSLHKFKIPVKSDTIGFFDAREIRYLLGILRMIVNPDGMRINIVIDDVITCPFVKFGIGPKTMEKIIQLSKERNNGSEFLGVLKTMRDIVKEEPKSKITKSIFDFVRMIERCLNAYHEMIHRGTNISDIIATIADISGLIPAIDEKLSYFKDQIVDLDSQVKAAPPYERSRLVDTINKYEGEMETYGERIKKIEELINIDCHTHTDMQDFLNEVVADKPEKEEEENNSVATMTIHSAKGLEWDYVFILGLSSAVLKTENMSGDICENGNDEETCRVCYVGVTRARKKLYLSYSHSIYSKETNLSRLFHDVTVRKNTQEDNFRFRNGNFSHLNHAMIAKRLNGGR